MPTANRRPARSPFLVALALATTGLALGALPAAAASPAEIAAGAVDRDAGIADRAGGPGQPRALNIILRKSGFGRPVQVTNAKDCRLFVVEQQGLVKILRPPGCHGATTWTSLATPFLDIRSLVRGSPGVDGAGTEEGLLSLAFHPNYVTNGRFYVYYTNTAGNNVVVQGSRISRDRGQRDGTILAIFHPSYSNHNGGMIKFKPSDGMLYISTGDGGGSGNPSNSAQNRTSLLGKILRINVNSSMSYSVPSNNPWATSSNANQRLVWSYGLRNPWRWSFDRASGHTYIGDVGQSRYEEVNWALTGRGLNYGWRRMEGRHCYPSGASCSFGTMPKIEYAQGSRHCSVTGGYVYRGSDYPNLYGRYVFADFCSGYIWNVAAGSTPLSSLPAAYASGRPVSGFGEGNDGELYMTDHTGRIYQVRG